MNPKNPPRPRGVPLLGVLPHFMAAPLDCLRDAAHAGPVVTLGPNTYFVNGPDEIKYIMQENHRNYDRRDAPPFANYAPCSVMAWCSTPARAGCNSAASCNRRFIMGG